MIRQRDEMNVHIKSIDYFSLSNWHLNEVCKFRVKSFTSTAAEIHVEINSNWLLRFCFGWISKAALSLGYGNILVAIGRAV